MGNIQNIQKVHFEDLQNSINHNNEVILINTLKSINQSCLIYNTIQIDSEEDIINNLLKKNKNKKIIIYGKNYNDITVYDLNIIEDYSDIKASVKDDVIEMGEDTLTFLNSYVDQIETDVSKQKLKEYLKSIYVEASEV